MELTVSLETQSRSAQTRWMLQFALMDRSKNLGGKTTWNILFHCCLYYVSYPALAPTKGCPWQYYITCNIIVIVWSHNIAFAGTTMPRPTGWCSYWDESQPRSSCFIWSKTICLDLTSIPISREFLSIWVVMTRDICNNESWYLGLCFWWSGIIKLLHIWDTWHRSNKTETKSSQSEGGGRDSAIQLDLDKVNVNTLWENIIEFISM